MSEEDKKEFKLMHESMATIHDLLTQIVGLLSFLVTTDKKEKQ